MFVLLGGLVMGCQAIISLDPGKKRPEGEGGAGGIGSEAGTTSSESSGHGGSGSGNSGSSSGSGSSSSSGAGGDTKLIDDLEDGNGNILMQGGRVGTWFTYNDMSGGTQTPAAGSIFLPQMIPGGRGASMMAAHTSGSGFNKWGAGLGFDLNKPGASPKMNYDVSAFTGITFWAKGAPVMRFKLLVPGTVPVVEGGTCSGVCGDNHGILIDLTQSWVQYAVPFAMLTQEGWGTPAAFDMTAVRTVEFSVGANVSFDFWIDDVAFY